MFAIIKPSLALLAAVLLAACVVACGSNGASPGGSSAGAPTASAPSAGASAVTSPAPAPHASTSGTTSSSASSSSSTTTTATTLTAGGKQSAGGAGSGSSGTRSAGAASGRRPGVSPTAAEQAAVSMTVESYYAALRADNGARACALLSAHMRREIAQSLGTLPSIKHKDCPGFLTQFFRHYPGLTATVTGARLDGDRGFALIPTRGNPSREIPVEREHGVWRVGSLLDTRQ